jgi:hypothetical protein
MVKVPDNFLVDGVISPYFLEIGVFFKEKNSTFFLGSYKVKPKQCMNNHGSDIGPGKPLVSYR